MPNGQQPAIQHNEIPYPQKTNNLGEREQNLNGKSQQINRVSWTTIDVIKLKNCASSTTKRQMDKALLCFVPNVTIIAE